MLTKIQISNFKSFREITLPLKPLTLLAGLNNSGKSSIFQILRMIWKWQSINDPALPGYGSLKELKNVNASKKSPILVQYTTESGDKVGMKIDFEDSYKPSIIPILPSSPTLPIMSYVSADRLGPRVSLPLYTASDDLTNVGEKGEYVIDFLSRHERDIVPSILRHPLSEGDTLEYNIRAWLEEIAPDLSFKHAIDPKRDSSYAEIDGFRPTNAGFGLSYTLPIIVLLLGMAAEWEQEQKSLQGTIVLLENPEAHLHPKGQTSIGLMIARAAASGVQVMVETHSDHVMDGIRIAVKEGLLDSERTVFHYFVRDGAHETKIVTPKLHPNGKIDFWPEGFFDQTLKNRSILARRS